MGNLIRSSGQEWKLTATVVALVLTGAATLFQYLGPRTTMVLGGLLILLTGFASLLLVASVRCPRCRKSLGWWAMKTQSPGSWYSVLAGLDECPCCRHKPPEEKPVADAAIRTGP